MSDDGRYQVVIMMITIIVKIMTVFVVTIDYRIMVVTMIMILVILEINLCCLNDGISCLYPYV